MSSAAVTLSSVQSAIENNSGRISTGLLRSAIETPSDDYLLPPVDDRALPICDISKSTGGGLCVVTGGAQSPRRGGSPLASWRTTEPRLINRNRGRYVLRYICNDCKDGGPEADGRGHRCWPRWHCDGNPACRLRLRLHHLRSQRRLRRHLAQQHLSRRRLRRAVALLFLLVRSQAAPEQDL